MNNNIQNTTTEYDEYKRHKCLKNGTFILEKEEIYNKQLGESYIRIKHISGCTILLYNMPNYSTTYALFGTKYGSVDTTFKTNTDDDFVKVPEGIAHYLEHKLFENDECNAFALFSKTGANANAFTSFDKTAYLFSSSRCFLENLEILLNFVQEPYFTDETVQKEQGIIGQEIEMYLDDPNWRVLFNGFNAIYHNNPVCIDVAGTKESIAKINKELLYRCYNTFYNLNNMTLAIAGNFDIEETLKLCDTLLKPSRNIDLQTIIPPEPYKVKLRKTEQTLDCSNPLFNIMFKIPPLDGIIAAKNFVYYNILFELAIGKTSAFYTALYNQGLINDTFNVSIVNGRGFFVIVVEGESSDPEAVFAEVKAELSLLRNNDIPQEAFNTIKKSTYGELITGFGNVENIALNMLASEFSGISLYDTLEITAEARLGDIAQALCMLDIENSSISIINPVPKDEK